MDIETWNAIGQKGTGLAGHEFLYNSSAIKNQQSTSFRKISAIVNLFCMISFSKYIKLFRKGQQFFKQCFFVCGNPSRN